METNINGIVMGIGERFKTIHSLIADKRKIYGGIQKLLHERAASKQPLTYAQIRQYQRFSDIYNNEVHIIGRRISELESDISLADVKKEIFKDSVDFGMIYDKFTSISRKQTNVINVLNNLVNYGRCVYTDINA